LPRPVPVQFSHLVALGVLAVALSIALWPAVFGLSPVSGRAAGLCLGAIGLWGTGAVPEFLTAFLFFLVGMLFAVAPSSVIFAGFSSTAWWLVVGGLVIGVAVKQTGVGDWLAAHLVGMIGSGFLGLIAGVVLVGVVMAFLMPSTMGRVMIIIPIVLAMADRYGFAPGSRGRDGMVLAMVLGTFVPSSAILPANVANMVLSGAAETIYGISLTYGSYLLLHFPVVGVLKALSIVVVTWALFRDRPTESRDQQEPAPKLSPAGRRVGWLLIVALLLWASDEWHGVNPAWIAVGAAVACLFPGIGVIRPDDFNKGMNAGSMFYVAGVLGMGAVLATQGVADALGSAFLDVLPLETEQPFWNFMLLSTSSALLGLGTAVPGIPAVMAPLAADFADATGFPLVSVLMLIVVGFSTLILPYQLPPMVVAMQLAEVRLRDAARLTLAVALIGIVVLAPLNYLWWRFLGYL